MIRLAAVGDLHFGPDLQGTFRPAVERLAELADALLIAGDLTRLGDPDEAKFLAEELAEAPVPVVAVLGNHDYQSDREDDVRSVMEGAGVRVLEGDGTILEANGSRVGVAGVKGFGGGFAGAHGTEFGEPEMKAFVRHARTVADRLECALVALECDLKVALTHYAPIDATLRGERPEIFPFLGSYLLAEALDRSGTALAIHGHAHLGTEKGVTPGGAHVRNVAHTVIRRPYNVYCLGAGGSVE